MKWILNKLRGLRNRWAEATSETFPEYPYGTHFSARYRLRRFLAPKYGYFPAYVQAASGTQHFLSNDPIDNNVLEEMLGDLNDIYFPKLPDSVKEELNRSGVVLDIGAYNGFWSAEMLVRHPAAKAILIEPNPIKCRSIAKTMRANGMTSKARIIAAGLAESSSHGWLVQSEEGSWGDWLQKSELPRPDAATEVHTRTLFEALSGAQPVIVKCNAEGAEYEFVRQLLALNLRPKLMVMMAHPEHGDVNQLRVTLAMADYKVTVVRDSLHRPIWHVELV
ncbi:MAG: FkbM family methyltransferase [Pyrinomonadaceae bacterium]|nr:FkbM family methyltransferase [Pyrinomonadaceae bacterium]